jgi:hypothetical protein
MQPLENFLHFLDSEDLLPHSQDPSTGRYSEPDQSSPNHPILSLCYGDSFTSPLPVNFS